MGVSSAMGGGSSLLGGVASSAAVIGSSSAAAAAVSLCNSVAGEATTSVLSTIVGVLQKMKHQGTSLVAHLLSVSGTKSWWGRQFFLFHFLVVIDLMIAIYL